MDLTKPSRENIIFMLEQIKEKLRMANLDAMKADRFDTNSYDDLHFIYQMVIKRNHISSNEIEAIVAELGALRN